ncbi:MAG: hypothetical protein AMJ65_10465 [Phycisphaerae bacterium SG8_4]|nr:MAG: hypothetical protein AMJ65_10465 [Phycisphaerae bacterium SG8_4]
MKSKSTGARKVLGRLTGDKKTVTALCLITLMAFMWIRVLTKKTPQAAEAEPVTEPSSTEDPLGENYRVSFVELPKVAGRNDVIVRDFFASDGWQHFIGGQERKPDGIEEVSIVSTNGNEELIKRVAEKLKLEATMVSTNPLAFVNGQVRRIGDKMLVKDGNQMYECEVVEIEENTVVIKCGKAEITLKLMPVSTVGD